VLDGELAVATAHEAFNDGSDLIDADLGDALHGVVERLVELVRERSELDRRAA
jgi:hypothetical protein